MSSLSFNNIACILGGTLLGLFVGAMPGLSATMALALLLPLTFSFDPATGLSMLASLYVGASYGGSIAAIILRIPGTPASAMTMLDGHAMAQGGRTGLAIALATFSSFVGGVFGGVVLVLFAPQLARVALTFQSPEMFALVALALVAVATVSPESLLKGTTATVIGLMLATVGIDRLVPVPRYTFTSVDLLVGVPLIPVVIGLFAVAELLHQSGEPAHRGDAPEVGSGRLAALWREVRSVGVGVWVKSPVIGTLVGALPGAGAAMEFR